MKKFAWLIAALLVVSSAISGCKTSEENYRRAYLTATEKQNAAYTDDEIGQMAAEERIPRTVYKGDSIPMRGMWINTVKLDSLTPRARRYNVVTGRYRQKFTAMSMIDRFRSSGYKDALLLIDKDQAFYVAPISTDTLDRAVEMWKQLSKESPVLLQSPFPYILRRP